MTIHVNKTTQIIQWLKNCDCIVPGFPEQVDHTLIIWYHTIIQIFFYDLTMINLESSMIQSLVNLEP